MRLVKKLSPNYWNLLWVVTIAFSTLLGCSGVKVDERRFEEEVSASEKTTQTAPVSVVEPTVEEKIAEGKRNATLAQQNTEANAAYHFSLAQAYVVDGNPDRAIEEYQLTLMFDPKSALVHARLAGEYIKKGMMAEAMETCRTAIALDPKSVKSVDARMILANALVSAKEFRAALVEYDQVLKLDPKNEEAAVYRAQAYAELGKVTEAVGSLRKFVKANSESAVGWFYLARTEEVVGQTAQAVTAYRKAMELRSGFTQAGLALGYLFETKGATQEAIATYKNLYESSQDAAAANRLATIYLKLEKYEEAEPYLESAQNLDPEDMSTRVKLGLVRMELKKYDGAIAVFKGILEKNPESDRIHYYLGSLYEELNDSASAIEEFSKIKPESKMYPESTLHTAYLIKGAQGAAQAKKFIADAIVVSPRSVNFLLFKASLEEDEKDYGAAVATLEGAIEKFPEDEKVRYYLGSLYDKQGNVEKGIAQMEAILDSNPENVDALNYIGYTWTQKGVRLDDAEKMLKRAVALRPDSGFVLDSWGWHLFVRGRTAEAVVQLEKAAHLKPNESVILEHLADAYLRANLRQKAQKKYQDALKFAENDQSREKLQRKVDQVAVEMNRIPASTPSQTPPGAVQSSSGTSQE